MTKFCAQCGKDVKDSVKFCPHCGHLKEGATPTKDLTAKQQKERRIQRLRQRVEASVFRGMEECFEENLDSSLNEVKCKAEKQRRLLVLTTLGVMVTMFFFVLYLAVS